MKSDGKEIEAWRHAMAEEPQELLLDLKKGMRYGGRYMKQSIHRLVCLSLISLVYAVSWAQKPELVVQTGHSAPVNSVAFSPDGRTLASTSYDKTIKLWDVTTGTELRTLKGHTDTVMSVA